MLGQPPARIAGLPTDHRGYPVPAENHWIDGVPQLARQDFRRCGALAAHSRCGICGFPMGRTEIRYRLFAFEEVQAVKAHGTVRRTDGPGHMDCMLYAGTVCPFFVTQRRSDVKRGAVRGHKAALLGFRRVQLAIDDPDFDTPVSFRYRELADQVWFTTGDRLDGLLAQARAQQPVTPPDERRMYWTSQETIPEWEAFIKDL
jgi:hypothetical protein